MSEQLRTDLGELERLASNLRGGASSLDGPARSAPDAPDVGESTGLVAGKLAEVAGTVLAIHQDLERVTDDVSQSRGQYHEADVDNAERLQPPR